MGDVEEDEVEEGAEVKNEVGGVGVGKCKRSGDGKVREGKFGMT